MSVLKRMGDLQGRRDEVPHQELARAQARTRDRAGIREIGARQAMPDSRPCAGGIGIPRRSGERRGALQPRIDALPRAQ
jgi:hypothetical protein